MQKMCIAVEPSYLRGRK